MCAELEYGSSLGSIELQVHRFGAHGIRQSQLSSGPIDTHKYADEAAGGVSWGGASGGAICATRAGTSSTAIPIEKIFGKIG